MSTQMKLEAKQRLLATEQSMQLTAADARAVLRKIKPTLSDALVKWMRAVAKAADAENQTKFFDLVSKGAPKGAGEKLGKEYAQIVKDLLKAVATQINNAVSEPAGSDGPMMVGIYLGDAADMLDIALDLNDGMVKRAAKKAANLDTSARDELPDSFNKLRYAKG